jgi:hypothetical protein
VETRNRITHPKIKDSLIVSEGELEDAAVSGQWFLDSCGTVLDDIAESIDENAEKFTGTEKDIFEKALLHLNDFLKDQAT